LNKLSVNAKDTELNEDNKEVIGKFMRWIDQLYRSNSVIFQWAKSPSRCGKLCIAYPT
jgi:hypothetical protein